MNRSVFFAALALTMVMAGSAGAQMMGGGPEMMGAPARQQERGAQQQNNEPCMMNPGMMGGYGFGPGMMGGCGMGPGMMGKHGWGMMGGYDSPEKYDKFLDATRDLRKKMHDLMFDYREMMRNPKSTVEDYKKMRRQMFDLQQKILEKALPE